LLYVFNDFEDKRFSLMPSQPPRFPRMRIASYLVLLEVYDRQESICIGRIGFGLFVPHFHRRPQQWLREDEICEGGQLKKMSIDIKKLL
jgi:hypothetical protein